MIMIMIEDNGEHGNDEDNSENGNGDDNGEDGNDEDNDGNKVEPQQRLHQLQLCSAHPPPLS